MLNVGHAVAYKRRLELIMRESPTALTRGEDHCCQSGVCCWRRPGDLSPEDVTALATHLKITEQELFSQYLVVDRIKSYLLVLFRRKHQQGGSVIGINESYSLATPCVFLDTENQNACKIHDAKPKMCREFKCWDPVIPPPESFPEEKLLSLGWDGTDPDDV